MTKILGDIRGLTALMSPNGKKVLYSESAGNSFALNLYDVGKRGNNKSVGKNAFR